MSTNGYMVFASELFSTAVALRAKKLTAPRHIALVTEMFFDFSANMARWDQLFRNDAYQLRFQ